MDNYKLGEMEKRFADMIWANQPVQTRALVELCQAEFGWKRTTTYTMLKRLCERGLFENSGGEVRQRIGRDDFGAAQGERFLQESFAGSLPGFLAAFTRRKHLSDDEIEQIQRLIDAHKGE